MFPEPSAEAAPMGRGPLASSSAYAAAVVVTALAVVSQYFLPQLVPALRPLYGTFYGGLFVVYGVPILAFSLLVGRRPLDRWAYGLRGSLAPSLGWYGAVSLLALGVTFLLLVLYVLIDPSAVDLLNRPNPVVSEAASDPWFWIAFSFVIGAVEETIFRGWIFGYWVARGSRYPLVHAVWTSALFAGVHLYYGITYGVVSPIFYSELFLLGFAFAMAVRVGRGNLVWVALLHGGNDATAFLQSVQPGAATVLHYGIILLGAGLAVVLVVRTRQDRPSPGPPIAWTRPPPTAWPDPLGGSTYPPAPVPVVPPMPPPPPPR